MKPSSDLRRIRQAICGGCLLGCLLAGCTVMGPAAVRSGRLAYNEAIIETENQQLLLSIVRNRYAERSNLLAVASVTANVSVTTSARLELGFGDESDFSGNLVPFGTGVVYEENPTISYIPANGERFARQLMSPVPIATLAQLARTRGADPTGVYYALVSSLNGFYNPDFLHPQTAPDPRFSRAVALLVELTLANRLNWVQDKHGRFSIVIDNYTPTYLAEVTQLLALLGLPVPKEAGARIVLPVSLALDGRDAGGVAIITRSVFDLVEILSGAVEVSEQEQRDGISLTYPPPGLVGTHLHIRRAAAEPAGASVAVSYRDAWFYIDDGDAATKQYFRLLGALYAIVLNEGAGKSSAAPVLTVPVSR